MSASVVAKEPLVFFNCGGCGSYVSVKLSDISEPELEWNDDVSQCEQQCNREHCNSCGVHCSRCEDHCADCESDDCDRECTRNDDCDGVGCCSDCHCNTCGVRAVWNPFVQCPICHVLNDLEGEE
jgi:hypothetical protein